MNGQPALILTSGLEYREGWKGKEKIWYGYRLADRDQVYTFKGVLAEHCAGNWIMIDKDELLNVPDVVPTRREQWDVKEQWTAPHVDPARRELWRFREQWTDPDIVPYQRRRVRLVFVKVRIVAFNDPWDRYHKDFFRSSYFEMVHRGGLPNLNDNLLKNCMVEVKYNFYAKYWEVNELFDGNKTEDNIEAVVYSIENGVVRMHSIDWPLDFQIAQEKIPRHVSKNIIGKWMSFVLPSDGINVEALLEIETNIPRMTIVNDDVVSLQMSCRRTSTEKLLKTRGGKFPVDEQDKLWSYMKGNGFTHVNGYFNLRPVEDGRCKYEVADHQPFLEAGIDGFDPDDGIKVRWGESEYVDPGYDEEYYGAPPVVTRNHSSTSRSTVQEAPLMNQARKDDTLVEDVVAEKRSLLMKREEHTEQMTKMLSILLNNASNKTAELADEILLILEKPPFTNKSSNTLDSLLEENEELEADVKRFEKISKKAQIFLIENDMVDVAKMAEAISNAINQMD